MNPDHEAPVNLYGRTGSYKDVKVGGGGPDIAKMQFDLMKKQAADNANFPQQLRDIWQWVKSQTLGAVPELSINGI
jgi:hypothetical protein